MIPITRLRPSYNVTSVRTRGEGVPRWVALKKWARKNKCRKVALDLPNTWGVEVTVE